MTSDRRWLLLSGVLLVALLGLMLATFLDYGMTADEPVQNRYGRRLVRWYASLGADRSAVEQHDTWLYGGFFELVAQGARTLSPLDVYETRHVVNTLFGFVGFLAVWWLGEGLGGARAGLLEGAALKPMLARTQTLKDNWSYLWNLMVLEMWMGKHG